MLEFSQKINEKLDKAEGRKIKDHFQRFAEYSDLKELYKKTLPEIAKFEQKIIEFKDDHEKI